MPFLNIGRSGTAKLWTTSGALPNGVELGTGSSTKTVGTGSLTTPVYFTTFTTTDTSVVRYVTFTADFSSATMSGISLREFAVKASGGDCWSAEGMAAVTFDGTNELQIQITWECY